MCQVRQQMTQILKLTNGSYLKQSQVNIKNDLTEIKDKKLSVLGGVEFG